MSKIVFFVLFFSLFLYSKSVDIGFSHTFSLKKDQIAEIVVIKDTPKTFPKEGELKFRWTLFQNERVVLLIDYEGFQSQYILQKRYGLNSIRIYVSGDYKKSALRDFLILRFVSFDDKRGIVKLDMEYVDLSKRFEIKILRPKK